MRRPKEQSRKIALVEISESGQAFFEKALPRHELVFPSSLGGVPNDTEILSVFVSEPVTADFLERLKRLKLLVLRGTASDFVDLEACAKREVAVVNAGNYGENTVAEHTFALMLALSRRLRDSTEAIQTGRFSSERLRGFDLRGKTLGVVGAGRVGLHVIRIGRGFGMKVIAYDENPHPFFGELLDFRYATFEELLAEADVITLHVPLNEKTFHLIGEGSLALCKKGVLIVNTARGALIDTSAVAAALDEGRVAGLGLDVLEDERVFRRGAASLLGQQIAERVRTAGTGGESTKARLAEFAKMVAHSSLLKRPNVLLTPHVAYNSDEAVDRLNRVTLENIRCYIEGKPILHPVA